jgi:DNA-binding beta-propeller fold protein YncE
MISNAATMRLVSESGKKPLTVLPRPTASGHVNSVGQGDRPKRSGLELGSCYFQNARQPHGLELDAAAGRLLCACDAGILFGIDAASGRVLGDVRLSGAPDVIFLNPRLGRLYVAIGDPGVIDVIDIAAMRREEVVPTESGAHTLALDRKRNKVYAFLPRSHRAAVFVDKGDVS